MKFVEVSPPRKYTCGVTDVEISDCAHIHLNPDEQVTFFCESGAEYDVARKSWGFYATPSLNGRLQAFNLRTALVKGENGKYHIFLVERGKEDEMHAYLTAEKAWLVCWMDSNEALEKIGRDTQPEL